MMKKNLKRILVEYIINDVLSRTQQSYKVKVELDLPNYVAKDN